MSNIVHIGYVRGRNPLKQATSLAKRRLEKYGYMFNELNDPGGRDLTNQFILPHLNLRRCPDGSFATTIDIQPMRKLMLEVIQEPNEPEFQETFIKSEISGNIREEKIERHLGSITHERRIKREELAAKIMRIQGEARNTEAMERSLTGKILADIRDGSSVLVQGTVKAGKSSICLSLARQYEREQFFYPICRPLTTEHSSAADHLARLKSELSREVIKFLRLKRDRKEEIKDPLGFLNSTMVAQGKRCLLFFDEVQYLLGHEEALNYLLMCQSYSNIDLVCAGFLNRTGESDVKKYFGQFKKHVIEPFSFDETEKYLTPITEEAELFFSKRALLQMHAIAGGRPQELLHMLLLFLVPNNQYLTLSYYWYDLPNSQRIPFYRWKREFNSSDTRNLMSCLQDFSATYLNIISDGFMGGLDYHFNSPYVRLFGDPIDFPETVFLSYFRGLLNLNQQDRQLLTKLAREDLTRREILREFSGDNLKMLVKMTYVRQNKKTGKHFINGELLRMFMLNIYAPHLGLLAT